MSEQGVLYVVATPIGNLEDITHRAVRILEEVSLVVCEDTRRTGRLLGHFGIRTRRSSFHEHNEEKKLPQLLGQLEKGLSLALVSDAGTPGISDPGYRLVHAARCAGFRVEAVPGPSAVVAALSVSGLPTDSFRFVGFLPAKKKARRRALESLSHEGSTLVFYEAPHRILKTLSDMENAFGASRSAFLARELTKLHEEHVSGTLEEILQELTGRENLKGEITLIVSGGGKKAGSGPKEASARSLIAAVEALVDSGTARMDAIKKVAREYGLPKSRVYDLVVAKDQP